MPKRKGRSNGEGSIYRRKSDGRWAAELMLGVDADGKRRVWRAYGKTRAEVAAKLNDALQERKGGRLAPARKETLGEYLTYWLGIVEPTIKPASYASYKNAVERFLIPQLGSVKLSKLDRASVQSFVSGLQKCGYSARYVRAIWCPLRIALNAAMDWEMLGSNPATKVKLPRIVKNRFAPWTPEQVRTLLETVKGDPDEALVLLAIVTGARAGELFALRWQDVNWQGAITIRASVTHVAGKGHVIGETKTADSARTVSIPAIAVDMLKMQRKRVAEWQLSRGAAWQNNDLVFPGATGAPRNGSGVVAKLNRQAVAQGLPHVTLRDLRHLHASLLLAQGASLKVVQERLGHSSIVMTGDTYSHLLGGVDREAAERIGRAVK